MKPPLGEVQNQSWFERVADNKVRIVPAVLHLHTTVLSASGSRQVEDDIVEGGGLRNLPVDTCSAATKDEDEIWIYDDETTYATLGGTRVVSNTKFLTERKLSLRLTNETRRLHYPLTSYSGSHTTGLPHR